MAARTQWKGYLKLSLVSCPIALYPAAATTGSERVSFHTLNRVTGSRVKRQFVDAETGDAVEPEDQVKGYEIGKGQHILVEDDEIAAIAIESSHTIDIDSFVPRAEVDERYLDTPYYVAPADRVAQEAFAIIREAMRKKGVVGIARVLLQRRERIIMLEPFGKGLLAITLRYAYQVRSEGAAFEYIAGVELQEELLDLAARIIETKTGKFDVSRYQDRYENALLDLVKAKQAGRELQPVATPRPTCGLALVAAGHQSLRALLIPDQRVPFGKWNSNSKSVCSRTDHDCGQLQDSISPHEHWPARAGGVSIAISLPQALLLFQQRQLKSADNTQRRSEGNDAWTSGVPG